MNVTELIDLSDPLLLRTSDKIPIPENQVELDTIPDSLLLFIEVFDIISCIGGVFGNLLTLAVVIANKKLHTVPNFFVAHLAVVDTVICGLLLPMKIYSGLTQTPSIACQVFAPVVILTMILSLVSLANIAINRYVLVCRHPATYDKIYTRRNIIFIMIGCYVYAFTLILPPFVGFGVWGENVKYKTCFYIAYDYDSYVYTMIFLEGLAFTPPATISVISYILIIKKFRESRAKFTKIKPEASSSDDSTGGTSVKKTAKSDKQAAAEAKNFKTILGMLMVFIVFLLCWLPLAAVYAIDYWGRWPASTYTVSIGFAWMNSSLNTLLYAWLNTNFREAYKLALTCKWRKLRE